MNVHPARASPTESRPQALLEKMEHFLNRTSGDVDDCAFLMGKISEEVVAHKSDIDYRRRAWRIGSGCSPGPWPGVVSHCSVSVIPRY
ncbi:MAG: hypothetical protein ACLSHC_08205 [Bilophila wadsworthia]